MKKALAFILTLLLLLPFCISCGKEEEPEQSSIPEEDNTELFSTVVLTVNGQDVTYEKFRYYYYGIISSAMEQDKAYYSTEEGMKELEKDILYQIKYEFIIKDLAKEYGLELTDKDKEQIEDYVKTADYYYKTQFGKSFESYLAEQHATLNEYKAQLAALQLTNKVLDHMHNEESGVVDFSDESVSQLLEGYYCTLHILLTKTNYTTDENVLKLATELKKFLDVASDMAEEMKDKNLSKEEILSGIETLDSAYVSGKTAISFMGSLANYDKLLLAIKEQLTSESLPCISYLKTTSEKLTDSFDVTKAVKDFAEKLSENGVTESTLQDAQKIYEDYCSLLEEMKNAYFSGQESSYLTTKQCDVKFALELLIATLSDAENATSDFFKKVVNNAFNFATLIFGEDRQDHDHGVYFKAGETDTTFEEAYLALSIGEISQPVQTDFGTHLILRMPNDPVYFKENLYTSLAVENILLKKIEAATVNLCDIYSTINMDNLK